MPQLQASAPWDLAVTVAVDLLRHRPTDVRGMVFAAIGL
jgi:hypothetical protein